MRASCQAHPGPSARLAARDCSWLPSDTPIHEREAFAGWRPAADRLAEWQAVERDPAMAALPERTAPVPLIARNGCRALLGRKPADRTLGKGKAAKRMRRIRDRGDGGGITPRARPDRAICESDAGTA